MNILLLTTHLNIGGIASYVVSLARNLKMRGHNVFVSSSGGDMAEELEKDGILHIKLNIKTKSELSPKLYLALPKLISLVRRNNIHLIHAHTRITQLLSFIVSRLSGIPYISTAHGFFKPRISRRILKCWGDKTIAISQAVRDHLINDFNVDSGDIALIHNGVDIKKFKNSFSKEEKDAFRKDLNLKGSIIIGAIGRLSPVKGYKYLIEAFKLVLDEYKDLELLMVGDGPQKDELEGISRSLKIEEHVTFARPNLNTAQLLSIIDLFVSSSVQEGLGLSLIEALASGKPVVATDVGGVSSLVRDNHTGLLVRSEDSKALSKAISQLLKDADLRKRLGENGRSLIERDFTIDAMVDKVEEVYKMAGTGLVIRGQVSSSSVVSGRNLSPQMKRPVPVSIMERILIVNVNWLGDVLFTTPFIKAIRKRYPQSYIACMVVPRCKEILEDNPRLDEIIIYDEDGEHKSIIGKLRLILYLRRKRFNISFILHRSFTRALIVFLSGIERRVGYNTKNRGFLLTKAIDEPTPGIHKVEYFLNIAKEFGVETDDKDYEFFVEDNERNEIDKFLKDNGIERNDILVVLNPGGNWPPKRWPKERFAELSDRLSNELGAKVVITGALKDMELARSIVDLSKTKPIDASGQTSLKRLGSLMERADLIVSSDSGPLHIAVGVKTKALALFGPTSDLITGPYGSGRFAVIKKDIDCSIPCYDFTCSDYRCMEAISIDEVFNKAKEMLRNLKADD